MQPVTTPLICQVLKYVRDIFLTFCANIGEVSFADAEKKGLRITRKYTCAIADRLLFPAACARK